MSAVGFLDGLAGYGWERAVLRRTPAFVVSSPFIGYARLDRVNLLRARVCVWNESGAGMESAEGPRSVC